MKQWQRWAVATAWMLGASAAMATITVSGSRDFGGEKVGTSCAGGSESQQPVILIKDGGSVSNVVLAAGKAADGIHCEGSCTLKNVTWEDVCEDAATMKGGSGKTMTVNGATVNNADDKIFQHNGVGSTVKLSNITVNGTNGKLYRSCGNCSSQGKRTATITDVTVNGSVKSGLAGVNKNYGDTVSIRSVKWKNFDVNKTKVCVPFNGVLKGNGEAKELPVEWNTTACNVSKTDITKF